MVGRVRSIVPRFGNPTINEHRIVLLKNSHIYRRDYNGLLIQLNFQNWKTIRQVIQNNDKDKSIHKLLRKIMVRKFTSYSRRSSRSGTDLNL